MATDIRAVYSFVAYPETNSRMPAVVVIHGNRGLIDWVRSFAGLATAGYPVIAPELLSYVDATHSRTSDLASSVAARDDAWARLSRLSDAI